MPTTATLNFDGSSKGNPGAAGSGYVLRLEATTQVRGFPFGRPATNNEAEYVALLAGLLQARRMAVTHLTVRGDSKLVIEQVLGNWRCRHAHLARWLTKCRALVQQFQAVDLAWIPRDQNARADQAANEGAAWAGRRRRWAPGPVTAERTARNLARLVSPDAAFHASTIPAHPASTSIHRGTQCLVPVVMDPSGNVCQILTSLEAAQARARDLTVPGLRHYAGLLCRDELSDAAQVLAGLKPPPGWQPAPGAAQSNVAGPAPRVTP